MDSPRDRRLRSDFRALTALKAESSILDFVAAGNPPERYRVRFRGAGLKRQGASDDHPQVQLSHEHEVEIYFGADYPRNRPQLQWKSEIFHPNISATGLVCLGGYTTHWVPSLNLDELVEMLWDMVRFANYDVKSPYNLVAARWTSNQRELKFPLDPRPIRDRGAADAAAGKPTATAAAGKPAPASLPKEVWDAVVSDQGDVVRILPAASGFIPRGEEGIVFIEPDAPPTPRKKPEGEDDILVIQ